MKIITKSSNDQLSFLVIVVLLLLPFMAQAQDAITLEFCYHQAEKNYPLSRQLDLLENSNTLKVKNLSKNYLPQFNISGGASLQSDVTRVSIDFPAGLPSPVMPIISKDWYKLTLDVTQSIYDGHVTHYQKQSEAFNVQADRKSVEIELYKLKERINHIFFAIVLLQKNESLLKSNQERIRARLTEVQSGVRNGAVLEMNADILQAELVRLDQQVTETQMDRNASCKMLSELIAYPVSDTTSLVLPDVTLSGMPFENKRLENELFSIQRSKVNLMRNMVTTKWNPKIFAYGQAGYGRPGLNMLDDSFKPWGLFGAKLTWSPWNWNQNKNEKQLLAIQNDMLQSQQDTFNKNLKISSQKDISEVLKFTELLTQDEQIIALRVKITQTASSQFDNGVISPSDYILRLNEETQSRLNLEIHKIQLIKAKISYLYTLVKL
ncbi:MAG: TolC family protein [Bacteroidales bacterium]|nr:TolC family protein [Bacteroidales bacterium]